MIIYYSNMKTLASDGCYHLLLRKCNVKHSGVGGRVVESGKSGVSHGKGEGTCWCNLCL